ncbi:MAG: YihY/virulence factor BrkB family protein [Cellulosilyticum sp.]|nr:YihY/virulence factor BrkB family protein [Cellulosilyticum sp.]
MTFYEQIKWLIIKLIKRYKSHSLSTTSAYMAYYWVLAFFPFIIFVISLLTYTNLPTGIFMEYVEEAIPKTLVPVVENTISQFIMYRSTTLVSVGGLITLWSAGTAVNALIKGIHIAYGSNYVRPFIMSRLVAIAYTILLAVVLILMMVGLVFGNRLGDYVFSMLHLSRGVFLPIWNLVRLVMPFIALVMVMYLLYRIIPRKHLKDTNVWPGVIFTSVSWYAFSLVFSIYVDNYSKYNQLYGSIGSVFVLLIWLYGSCTLLLIGAEINAILQDTRTEKIARRLSGN